MKADYHIHTMFSDDSRELPENHINRALEMGLDEICFTDHVDYGIKKDWSEGNIVYRQGDGIITPVDEHTLMVNVDYPRYFAKIHELRAKFAGKIIIKTGLEFGVQTFTVDRYEKLFAAYRDELDFILLSIHQIDNLELFTHDFQRGKSQKEYNEAYYRELYEVVKNFKHYSVLAHMNLICRYDQEDVYPFAKVKDMIAEILKIVIADGKGIELNTSSWHYKLPDTTPSRDILRLYRDLGGKIITMGSDAHSANYLADHFADARQILRNEIGFEYICTFDKVNDATFHKIDE